MSPLFIPPDDAAWETVRAFPVGPNRVIEEDPSTATWVPLVETNHVNRSHLGLTSAGEWIDAVPDRHATKSPEQRRGLIFGDRYQSGYFYLTPMLEWSPSVVRSAAGHHAESFGFDVDVFWDAIPWRQTIRAGIRSGRNQWVNPALDWAILLDVTDTIIDDLRAVADGPSLSDDTRARISQLVDGAER